MVFDQQQVQRQELRFQGSGEGQQEELSVHLSSAGIRIPR
jgi:hypothetical protein